ncbi:hypothetical protein Tco_1391996 [Tanacetum coccineum]
MDTRSQKNYETDNSENGDEHISDNDVQEEEEGEIRDDNVIQEDDVVDNISPNKGNATDVNNKTHSWADDVEKDFTKLDSPQESHVHSPQETPEVHNTTSDSISKPPGFEGFKANCIGEKRQDTKKNSASSFSVAKTLRKGKSHSKSLSSNGSLIDTFISHIEMGKILGYDMEGSKRDLKKIIDSLGVNHGRS